MLNIFPIIKDTKLPPEEVEYVIEKTNRFSLLKETDNFKFYFKDERDVFAIFDKRNNYLWKTGLDVPFGKYVEDECEIAPMDKKLKFVYQSKTD